MMNPFYLTSHNTPVLTSDDATPPLAWTFLMVYHLVVYLAYGMVWLWTKGFELYWLGAAVSFLVLFTLTGFWVYQIVSQVMGQKRLAVLSLLGHGGVILLVMGIALWILPFHFLLACLVSMGVMALIHILVTIQNTWQRRWRTIDSVQEIVCAGRYRLGVCQVEIDRWRGGFNMLLTNQGQQAEYRFANLSSLRLYLDAVLPRS